MIRRSSNARIHSSIGLQAYNVSRNRSRAPLSILGHLNCPGLGEWYISDFGLDSKVGSVRGTQLLTLFKN